MLSHVTAMGLLLLRPTATLAWAPVVQWSRSVARPSGYAECFYQYRRQVAYPSINTRSLSCVSTSSTSTSGGGLRTLATTTASALVGDKDGSEEGVSGVGKAQVAGEEKSAVGSGGEIQPLLQKHLDKMGPRRKLKTRQHVNPLSASYQEPAVLQEQWFKTAYRNPSAPLMVDIGCAKGSFLMSMAKAFPERNFLGLEIRRPVAAVAVEKMGELGTQNCHLVCCNVNVDLDSVLAEATRNGAVIDTICIQFPDPHFKAKHYKRRMLQPELVKWIEAYLQPGGTFFMQSDILDIMEDMRTITRETAEVLEDSRPDMADWMEGADKNPFGVQTEREIATYAKDSPEENRVYRCLFKKKA